MPNSKIEQITTYLQSQGIQVTGGISPDGKITFITTDPSKQQDANTIIMTWPPLDYYKTQVKNGMYQQAISMVESRYPASVLSASTAMMATGKQNQANYCKQLFTWVMNIHVSYATAAAAIDAATTKAGVDAVVFDAASLLAADPKINLADAANK